MFQVDTFIVDTDTGEHLHIKNYSPTSKKELVYGFIEIYHANDQIFVSTIEVLPDYWFIVLQMIEEVFSDGEGEWEFPSLVRFKCVDVDLIQVTQDEEIYYFPKRIFIHALLEGCTEFIHTSDKFLQYRVEINEVKKKFLTDIEKLHEKNNNHIED